MSEKNISRQPISLYLISGFLGSGKTTFLKRLLKTYEGEPIGLIVNEFGQVGIDGSRLKDDEVSLVEINNGSIFCACIKDGFVRTLKAFSEQPISTLLIENSGMADPSSMNRLLKGMAPFLSRPFEYQGSVCLVDCLTFLEYYDMFYAVQNQISASTIVLVNKTDLCGPETLREVHEAIAEINPDAFIVDTVYADLPMDIFKSRLFNNEYDAESSNTPENRPEAFLLEDNENTFTSQQIEGFCRELVDSVWRIKGYFRMDKGFAHIDVASKQIDIKEEPEGSLPRTQIVVIGPNEQAQGQIEAAWRKHCGKEIQIRR